MPIDLDAVIEEKPKKFDKKFDNQKTDKYGKRFNLSEITCFTCGKKGHFRNQY